MEPVKSTVQGQSSANCVPAATLASSGKVSAYYTCPERTQLLSSQVVRDRVFQFSMEH
jgi:hypothetical protein